MDTSTTNQGWAYGGPRHKIILGIDYGTTFSGVSYVTTDKCDIQDINLVTNWPGTDAGLWKAPTRIAYALENLGMRLNRWGFEVDPDHKSYSWTKLQLDANARPSDYDDPSLTRLSGQIMMALPSFRDAAGVCEDFLRELYIHTNRILRKEIDDYTVENTVVECWITLPAIWSEEAKHATLTAARNAGFANGPDDEIFTIAEPEAAAIATLTAYADPFAKDAIKVNEHILICDCGGGTVDVTTYTVTQVNPQLTFDELCIGIGGKCGSTYIDRNFHALLSERFGQAFDDLSYNHKGIGSAFMACFENVKCDFGLEPNQTMFEIDQLKMDVATSAYYQPDERTVVLSHEDMKGLFDPVIQEITSLVEDQVERAKNRRGAQINRIILVGGFGGSPYLQSELTGWCKAHGDIMLLCPKDPQAAIVKGAALRGLEGLTPRIKHARRHYGFICGMPFRPGRDDEEHSFINEFDDMKMCSGLMRWMIAKGESVFMGDYRTISVHCPYAPGKPFVHATMLYSSALNAVPERYDDPRVEVIGRIDTKFPANFDFGEALESTFNPRLRRTVYRIAFKVEVIFGDRGENLKFRTSINGVVGGSTQVIFPRT
ncbi:Hsp70 family protein-like protein [Acephala macrosclerotiorum]|nr:Hsp70 family protein-like protein [Acephala macrosclerotiorum]